MWDRDPMPRTLTALAAALVAAAIPTSASAAPALNGTFPTSGQPRYLAKGADGNIWFTLTGSSASKEFGKITPNGTVTEFDSNPMKSTNGITAGPNSTIWLAEDKQVVR